MGSSAGHTSSSASRTYALLMLGNPLLMSVPKMTMPAPHAARIMVVWHAAPPFTSAENSMPTSPSSSAFWLRTMSSR